MEWAVGVRGRPSRHTATFRFAYAYTPSHPHHHHRQPPRPLAIRLHTVSFPAHCHCMTLKDVWSCTEQSAVICTLPTVLKNKQTNLTFICLKNHIYLFIHYHYYYISKVDDLIHFH